MVYPTRNGSKAYHGSFTGDLREMYVVVVVILDGGYIQGKCPVKSPVPYVENNDEEDKKKNNK
jgi:hypothetical protein